MKRRKEIEPSLGFKETTAKRWYASRQEQEMVRFAKGAGDGALRERSRRWVKEQEMVRCGFFAWFQRNHTKRKEESVAWFQRNHSEEMGLFLVKKKPHHPFFERLTHLARFARMVSKKAIKMNPFFSSIRKGKKEGKNRMISFQFNPTNKI